MATLLQPHTASAQTVLEVIELRHRPAEEVIPLIHPFLDPRGAMNGQGFTLIVRTTPQNLQEIKDLLANLDGAMKRLLVSVRHGLAGSTERRDASVSGSVELGDDVRVGAAPQPGHRRGGGLVARARDGDSHVEGRLRGDRRQTDDAISQQLQVLEGEPAYIHTGTAYPYPAPPVMVGPGGMIAPGGTYYQDIGSGFYVTARISDDIVLLDISPYAVAPQGRRDRRLRTQSVQTTVSGRVGEWIDIGGVSQQHSAQTSGYFDSSRTRGESGSSVLIKVEVLD